MSYSRPHRKRANAYFLSLCAMSLPEKLYIFSRNYGLLSLYRLRGCNSFSTLTRQIFQGRIFCVTKLIKKRDYAQFEVNFSLIPNKLGSQLANSLNEREKGKGASRVSILHLFHQSYASWQPSTSSPTISFLWRSILLAMALGIRTTSLCYLYSRVWNRSCFWNLENT